MKATAPTFLIVVLIFSISHSGKIAVCALSTKGNVGVDIEQLIPMSWSNFKFFFEFADWNYAMGHRRREFALFELWTQREACIKTLDSNPFTEEPFSFEGWNLWPLDVDVTDLYGYAGTIATQFETEISVADLDGAFQQTIRDTD